VNIPPEVICILDDDDEDGSNEVLEHARSRDQDVKLPPSHIADDEQSPPPNIADDEHTAPASVANIGQLPPSRISDSGQLASPNIDDVGHPVPANVVDVDQPATSSIAKHEQPEAQIHSPLYYSPDSDEAYIRFLELEDEMLALKLERINVKMRLIQKQGVKVVMPMVHGLPTVGP
jgi:hypothetical protein